MNRARRLAPLAILVAASTAGCHHVPDKVQRAAALFQATDHAQLTLYQGYQRRLAAGSDCATAEQSLVSFIGGQTQALKTRAGKLEALVATMSPKEIAQAKAMAAKQARTDADKMQALSYSVNKLLGPFDRRCHHASMAAKAAMADFVIAMQTSSKVRRAASLFEALSDAQIALDRGYQKRLAAKPACAEGQQAILSFVAAQHAAIQPKLDALETLRDTMTPGQTRQAQTLAKPHARLNAMEMSQLMVATDQVKGAFTARCPAEAKAAGNAKAGLWQVLWKAGH